jgi:hypothetical protein
MRFICSLFAASLASAGPECLAQSKPIYPTWWASQGVLSGTVPEDFSAANQGMAKNMAVAGVNALDTELGQFGGAGTQLDQLKVTLSMTTAQTSDFSAVSLGMLKTLSQPFYDRLLALGYNGPPLTSGTYPWAAPGVGAADDWALGNVGQLKFLFSFDPAFCSNSNNSQIPDWWLEKYFGWQPGDSLSFLQNGDSHTGLSYLNDYLEGRTPAKPFVTEPPGTVGGVVALQVFTPLH